MVVGTWYVVALIKGVGRMSYLLDDFALGFVLDPTVYNQQKETHDPCDPF